ncbi:hypothetical protein [Cellulomonas soli]
MASTQLPGRSTMNPTPATAFAWQEWLARYAPQGVACWLGIAPFVRDSASAFFTAQPPTSKSSALSAVRAIVDLSAFQHGKTTLTRKTVFTAVTVEQYVRSRSASDRRDSASGPKSDRAATAARRESSRGDRKSYLLRVGAELNPGGGWGPKSETHRRFVNPPYSPAEIALLEDSVNRNFGLARRNGEATIVLGLGAGLAGRALLVQARDCHVSVQGIEIEVEGRRVPVLARYEARLVALLKEAKPDDRLLGSQARHKNAVNEAVARVEIAKGAPALSPGRLRQTWLLGHLAAGVDVKTLMAAAGLKSLTPISDLAHFLPDLSHTDATAMLRRGGQR